MDDGLYRALKKIQEKPTLHFGKKSLESLDNFIYGYIYCVREQGNGNIDFLPGFQEFICKKYGLQGVGIAFTKSYRDIILFCSASEEDAFDKFFELLDEFMKETKDINIDDYVRNYSEEIDKAIEKKLLNDD